MNMDFTSLMMFRSTSQASFELVRQELDLSLEEVLTTYVPNPAKLRAALGEAGAFIGGSAALRFFLRLPPDPHNSLDIFACAGSFAEVSYSLLCGQDVNLVLDTTVPTRSVPGTTYFLELDTKNGRRITIYHSKGHSLLPIAHTPSSSSLAAYVNPRHFGLVWPKLTLGRRAMTNECSGTSSLTTAVLGKQVDMDTKLWPWMWPDVGVPRQQCARRLFMCPAQERSFTDDGALHGSFNPCSSEPLDVRIAFRLCIRDCRGTCSGPQTHLQRAFDTVVEY